MRTIDTTCGIFSTKYALIRHRDGTLSVKAPYIKWVDNSGSLAFKKVKITKFADQVHDCFNGVSTYLTISELVFENELTQQNYFLNGVKNGNK